MMHKQDARSFIKVMAVEVALQASSAQSAPWIGSDAFSRARHPDGPFGRQRHGHTSDDVGSRGGGSALGAPPSQGMSQTLCATAGRHLNSAVSINSCVGFPHQTDIALQLCTTRWLGLDGLASPVFLFFSFFLFMNSD